MGTKIKERMENSRHSHACDHVSKIDVNMEGTHTRCVVNNTTLSNHQLPRCADMQTIKISLCCLQVIQMSSKKIQRQDVEDIPRDSFTPGWSKSISEVDALPVKRNGKVVRVTKIQTDANEASDIESEVEEEIEQPKKQKSRKNKHEETEEDEDKETQQVAKKAKAEKVEIPMVYIEKTPVQIHKLQQRVSEVCNSIVSAPERSLRKKSQSVDDEADEDAPRMVDLFEMLRSNDAQIFEMAMLSALIVFKDICPSYRIRSGAEYDKEVQLKKDTKSMKDYELSLLGAYQKYLKVLETKIEKGLGSAKREITTWGLEEKLGLSALRCQCELLRSLSHFNFRTQLLASICLRATQPDENISILCCDTISKLVRDDIQGELSYEIVKDVAKVLMLCKYNCSDRVLRCLTHVRMNVHADDAKDVHRKAKSERKKRKKNQDEVELGLLESNATADIGNKKRFQADCLHETCLMYFRIIKGKVGFSLLPVALEGLGRITHLMNIDMVQDLMTCLKSILEQTIPAPIVVQLQCVHCALRTLSGPGSELNLDSDIYLNKFRALLRDLPGSFMHWDVVLDCLDLCFLKKREERTNIVQAFVRLLLMSAIHESNIHGAVIYAMTHAILQRYPRVRQDLLAIRHINVLGNNKVKTLGVSDENNDEFSNGKKNKNKKEAVLFTEDEVVEDLAMKSLREEAVGDSNLDNVNWDFREDKMGDGSWVMPLQRRHIDPRYVNIVDALTHKELLPMPLRVSDLNIPTIDIISQRLAFAIQTVSPTLKSKNNKDKHSNETGEGKNNGKAGAKKKSTGNASYFANKKGGNKNRGGRK